MEGIRNWVITRIVIAGVTFVINLSNPAGWVMEAIRITFNLLMWFIERYEQIAGLVESIGNSIATIAACNISNAASYIEQTMARILPLIISLLASLLGLGGISTHIRRIFQRIRRPIDRGINGLVRWIARRARRWLRRGRVAAVRVAQWWRNIRRSFSDPDQGETHSLYLEQTGEELIPMVNPRRGTVLDFVIRYQTEISPNDPKKVEKEAARREALNIIGVHLSGRAASTIYRMSPRTIEHFDDLCRQLTIMTQGSASVLHTGEP